MAARDCPGDDPNATSNFPNMARDPPTSLTRWVVLPPSLIWQVILEEPEHLNWYHNGRKWNDEYAPRRRHRPPTLTWR
eukprot:914721-Prymnesium_polylepis.2